MTYWSLVAKFLINKSIFTTQPSLGIPIFASIRRAYLFSLTIHFYALHFYFIKLLALGMTFMDFVETLQGFFNKKPKFFEAT